MAVEAARDCLGRRGRDGISQIFLASTTLPFQDRQNAGVVAEALRLAGAMGTLDVAGSQRAGTSALITACRIAGGGGEPVLVTSAEKRRTKAASPLELTHRRRVRSAARRRRRRHCEAARTRHVLHRFRRSLPRAGRAVRLRLGGALGARRGVHEDCPRGRRSRAVRGRPRRRRHRSFLLPLPDTPGRRERCEEARPCRGQRARQSPGDVRRGGGGPIPS